MSPKPTCSIKPPGAGGAHRTGQVKARKGRSLANHRPIDGAGKTEEKSDMTAAIKDFAPPDSKPNWLAPSCIIG